MKPLQPSLMLLPLLVVSACDSAVLPTSDADPGDGGTDPDGGAAPLAFGACDLTGWPTGWPAPLSGVECSTLEVPLDYRDPHGAMLRIRIGRRAALEQPPQGAVFIVTGGPGQASVESSGFIPSYFPGLQATHDLIFVDQRGTSGETWLGCADPRSTAEWNHCAAEHASVELAFFGTRDAARDIEHARQRLGYGRVHLWGGSYGSRLTLEYLRLFPDRVQTAVLDGVAPPNFDWFAQMIGRGDQAIAALIERCNDEPGCRDVVPDLAADLETWRAQLRAEPRPGHVGRSRICRDRE